MRVRFSIHILAAIVVLGMFVLSSGLAFLFAWNPEIMLYIEEVQPGAANQRGLALIREGKNDEALRSFERGYDYFLEIYKRTGERRHRLQVVQALLGIAHVYKNRPFPEDWRQARDVYQQAIELEPDWPGGQPYLSLGEVLLTLNEPEPAIEAFTRSLERSSGRFDLKALLGRGISHIVSGNSASAADDLYAYIRYGLSAVSVEQWATIQTMDPEAVPNPKALFVRAIADYHLGEADQALDGLEDYATHAPGDPAARFYYSVIGGETEASGAPGPFTESSGELFDQVYRPLPTEGDQFTHVFVDVYHVKNPTMNLAIELSGQSNSDRAPAIEVLANRAVVATLSPISPIPETTMVTIPVQSSRTVVELREQWVAGVPPLSDLYLHSLRAGSSP